MCAQSVQTHPSAWGAQVPGGGGGGTTDIIHAHPSEARWTPYSRCELRRTSGPIPGGRAIILVSGLGAGGSPPDNYIHCSPEHLEGFSIDNGTYSLYVLLVYSLFLQYMPYLP